MSLFLKETTRHWRFYKNRRQSPVLGDEEFRNGLMEKPIRVDHKHPRYERAAVRPSIDQVRRALATWYGSRSKIS
jgi:hypothetical protein